MWWCVFAGVHTFVERQTHPRAVGGRVIHHNCWHNCQQAPFGRICKQQNKSETSACRRNKTKQKRQQRWDVALPCLRGMQHSLRHIFVCSTCEMGYLLRAHCGHRSTPLCGHNGGSFQGRGADRPLRPWAARWLKVKQSPHTGQSVSQNCCICCAQTSGIEPTGNMKKGEIHLARHLFFLLCLLVWLFRAACRSHVLHLAELQQAAWFHVTKTEDRKRHTEVETNEMHVQEFGMIIAGKHLHKDT